MKRRFEKKNHKQGSALLVVLFIVMAITVLSLGFLSRCDTELACGQNMVLCEQMDSLAYSGLEHAKGLILYPQDIPATGYWTGGSAQQLAAGDDYYNVNVAMHNAINDADPTYRCTYDVNSEAYRLKNGAKVGKSSIKAELRLDPCIAYGSKVSASIPSRIIICGDTYCSGSILNMGTINGDIFTSALSGSGTVSGQTKAVTEATVAWPNDVTVANFTSSTNPAYSVTSIAATVSGFQSAPYTPPKVYYCNGTMKLQGTVTIEGMLVVQGDLTVSGTANNINAGKNLPALLVTGDLIIDDGGELSINGLAVVKNRVRIRASAGNFYVYGGLFAENGLFETAADSSGNANTALLYNCPTWRPSGGHTNGAIEFDGIDDYLQTADSSTTLQIANDYTFSVWVKADTSQKDWSTIFAKTDSGALTTHWTLQFDQSSPRKVVVRHPTDTWDTRITLTDIAGAWHNIRIVRSGDTMRSYLDGVQKRSESWHIPPGWGNGHFNIGVNRTASSSYVFKGLIDELAIYNQAAVGANDTPAGLIGYWTFDKSGNGTVNIFASPDKAAIVVWNNGNPTRWGQAGGAFYRYIKRN
jgi:hypothetical protein